MGKTSAIRATAAKMGVDLTERTGDFCASVLYKGKKVGFASMGDPGSAQEDSLKNLMNEECEVIVGACRTKGLTTNIAMNLAAEYDYKILWTKPFNFHYFHEEMNDIFSDAMIKAIDFVVDK